ncbi:MAG: hypothetical protein ACRBB6_13335, partial [Neptuniibacter sp.]
MATVVEHEEAASIVALQPPEDDTNNPTPPPAATNPPSPSLDNPSFPTPPPVHTPATPATRDKNRGPTPATPATKDTDSDSNHSHLPSSVVEHANNIFHVLDAAVDESLFASDMSEDFHKFLKAIDASEEEINYFAEFGFTDLPAIIQIKQLTDDELLATFPVAVYSRAAFFRFLIRLRTLSNYLVDEAKLLCPPELLGPGRNEVDVDAFTTAALTNLYIRSIRRYGNRNAKLIHHRLARLVQSISGVPASGGGPIDGSDGSEGPGGPPGYID